MFDFALTHAYLIPLFPALAFLIIGPFTRSNKNLSATIAIFMMVLSLIFSVCVALATQVYGITMNDPFVMQITWARIADLPLTMGIFIDPLTAMMLLVVTLVSLLVYIYSASYMANDPGMGRFFAFISLFSATMLGLVGAVSFLQLYVFWEGVGLCSYLLIGFYYEKVKAREAAKKAFITTRIGDFGMLVGIIIIAVLFGTTDFLALRALVPAYVLAAGTTTPSSVSCSSWAPSANRASSRSTSGCSMRWRARRRRPRSSMPRRWSRRASSSSPAPTSSSASQRSRWTSSRASVPSRQSLLPASP